MPSVDRFAVQGQPRQYFLLGAQLPVMFGRNWSIRASKRPSIKMTGVQYATMDSAVRLGELRYC
jgi:hypothetical protein